VLRVTEPDFALVECFGADNRCLVTPRCRLRGVLGEALAAFVTTLDRYTLADLVLKPEDFGLAAPAQPIAAKPARRRPAQAAS
jgi:Rrf2 family nitric oxide-sensitive transcriptional repressor